MLCPLPRKAREYRTKFGFKYKRPPKGGLCSCRAGAPARRCLLLLAPASPSHHLHRRYVMIFKEALQTFSLNLPNFLQQPYAPIPPEHRVIITRRPDLLRFFKTPHRLLKRTDQHPCWTSRPHLRFSPSLLKQSQIVEAFVRIGKVLKHLLRFGIAV